MICNVRQSQADTVSPSEQALTSYKLKALQNTAYHFVGFRFINLLEITRFFSSGIVLAMFMKCE